MTKLERKIAEYHQIDEDELFEDFHVICPRCRAYHAITGWKLMDLEGNTFQYKIYGKE